jgi:hypothetical protein
MQTSPDHLAGKPRVTQPAILRHPDDPEVSARLLCYLGPDMTTGKSANHLRQLVADAGVPSRIVAYANARRRTENELTIAMQHMAPGAHVMLDLHGELGRRHLVDAGIVEPQGIVTADLLAWMSSRMPRRGPDLPVFHVLSCKSGGLADDIIPGSDRWRAAYVIVYAGKKEISLGQIDCALSTGMRYLNHCHQQGRRVDPLKLFLLAGMRRGDCMTLLGGELQAPVRWHGPKTGKDLADTKRLARLMDGDPSDLERLAQVAGSMLPDETALLPELASALKDIFRARLMRMDLPRLRKLLQQQPALLNASDCTGFPPLHDAVDDHCKASISFLVKHGAALDVRDHHGDTALMHLVSTTPDAAEREAARPILEHLLKLGANPNDCGRDGLPVLMAAIDTGWTDAVRILLAHKADPNLRFDEITPLAAARNTGHQEIIELLEKAGARE